MVLVHLKQPVHPRLLGPRVLTHHNAISYEALCVHRHVEPQGSHRLGGERPELILRIAHLVGDERQGMLRLSGKIFRLLSRQARQEVVQRGEAGIDESGVLAARGESQGVEERRNAGIGDIVLLDAGLDGCDVLDLVIDKDIFPQDLEQAGDLLIRKFFCHDPRGLRIWQLLETRRNLRDFFFLLGGATTGFGAGRIGVTELGFNYANEGRQSKVSVP